MTDPKADPTTGPGDRRATSTSGPVRPDPEVFAGYLARTRWFGGKGRPFTVTGVRRLGRVPCPGHDGPEVVISLVEVTYGDSETGPPGEEHAGRARVELYQVPLVYYTDAEQRLDHAFLGWWEEPDRGWVHAYDALHDKAAMACWLHAIAAAGDRPFEAGPLRFHRLPGHDLDVEAHSTLFAGEQSNSSVAFGEDSLMKVFRKITPGANPDIEVHHVLTRVGSPHVPRLYGWVEHAGLDDAGGGEVLQLAMIQQFLRTATDGWDLALTSVRNLFAEGDLHAAEVGGDFAAESARLGEALRDVHDDLARHFPTSGPPTRPATDIARAMTRRLEGALPVVPALAEHADALRAAYARLEGLGEVPVQQIHGDLHLGQTLRTSKGWKIVDFEGEPARPLAERRLPDSRWRDVAGLLRSLDYAPHVVQRTMSDLDAVGTEQRAFRAREWATRNRRHLLAAYAGGETRPEELALLDAYVVDKAVYETVYETRNRPAWVAIPLDAIARITGA